MADQAPEHHPGTEQVGVEGERREVAGEVGFEARGRRRSGGFDACHQGLVDLAGEGLVGLRDQGVDTAEVVIDQSNGDIGLPGDAAHRNAGMSLGDQAAQGGAHQMLAAFVRVGAGLSFAGCIQGAISFAR
ncbi:hypothetical protein D9M68_592060 [compost metagenome]